MLHKHTEVGVHIRYNDQYFSIHFREGGGAKKDCTLCTLPKIVTVIRIVTQFMIVIDLYILRTHPPLRN